MESLIGALASGLVEALLSPGFGELYSRSIETIGGDPKRGKALREALRRGLTAALSEMRPSDRDRLTRYAGVLKHFFALPQATGELLKLLDVAAVLEDSDHILDVHRLDALFREKYPITQHPDAYEGLHLEVALRAFVREYAATLRENAASFPQIRDGLLLELVARTDARPRYSTLRASYLRTLVESCNLLPLNAPSLETSLREGIEDSIDEQHTTLSQVYVPLDVLLTPQPKKLVRQAVLLSQGVPASKLEEVINASSEKRVPALRAISKTTPVALLGDPGSGKSTLINYLAICLANAYLEPEENWMRKLGDYAPDQSLPVRILLGQLAARAIPADVDKGNAGMIWDFMQTEIRQHGFEEFFPAMRTELIEKGGVLLFDGLDEVPSLGGRRERVCEAILDFMHVTRKCRIIVTCRTYAYLPNLLPRFEPLWLAHFSPKQVAQFVDSWYGALVSSERFTSKVAAQRSAALRAAIHPDHSPLLADLAKRPLLLTLMSMLHSCGAELPEDRVDLYEQCIELLLDQWQQRKKVKDPSGAWVIEGGLLDTLGIEKGVLRQALHRIAYEAHNRQGKGTLRDVLTADVLLEELKTILEPALGSADKFNIALHYINNRAGLISRSDSSTYTFPHRSFQEYLAACHVSDLDSYLQETRRHVRTDLEWWREVCLLEIGKGRDSVAKSTALLSFLCPGGYRAAPIPEIADWQTAVFVAQAMVDIHLLDRIACKRKEGEDVLPSIVLIDRVREWLAILMDTPVLSTRERMEAGLTLGSLRDPRDFNALCNVPGGGFMMGAEREFHFVSVDEFWIGKYEVTNSQYARFVQAGGNTQEQFYRTHAAQKWLASSKKRLSAPRPDSRLNVPNLPAAEVTWFEANAYCAWLTTKWRAERRIGQGQVVRLPTEAEWEMASKCEPETGNYRTYPWGSDPDVARANNSASGLGNATPVGMFPLGASPCHALDMAGNVWEWCNSLCKSSRYALDAEHESSDAEDFRVLRGGSWNSTDEQLRNTYRHSALPSNASNEFGFRIVVASPLSF